VAGAVPGVGAPGAPDRDRRHGHRGCGGRPALGGGGTTRAPLAGRPGARRRRAVRHHQRAERGLDRRVGRDRAAPRDGLPPPAELPGSGGPAERLGGGRRRDRGGEEAKDRGGEVRLRPPGLGRARRPEPLRACPRGGPPPEPPAAGGGGQGRGPLRARPAPPPPRPRGGRRAPLPGSVPAAAGELDLQAPGLEPARARPDPARGLRRRLAHRRQGDRRRELLPAPRDV
ncbi:MAG: hypothetical protein AVDCRST_MAG49-4610, partial [uncultured Thermomicrobiales bacterium]